MNELSNYKPKCPSTSFAKIFEKILANRILKFFQKFLILSMKQHGFITKCITETAILQFLCKIIHALEEGEIQAEPSIKSACWWNKSTWTTWTTADKLLYYSLKINDTFHSVLESILFYSILRKRTREKLLWYYYSKLLKKKCYQSFKSF